MGDQKESEGSQVVECLGHKTNLSYGSVFPSGPSSMSHFKGDPRLNGACNGRCLPLAVSCC